MSTGTETAPTSAAEVLDREHRLVEAVLGGLAALARDFGTAAEPPVAEAREVLWFLKRFTDGCHHAKEEEILFPLLERRGLSPNMGPTATMRLEHRLGGRLIQDMEAGLRALASASDEAGRLRFARAALAYVELLGAHIRKEDHCVFPLVDSLLGEDDRRALAEAFAGVDRDFARAEGGTLPARVEAVAAAAGRWVRREAREERELENVSHGRTT